MQPGDRLVCVFVSEPPLEFKDWPLHVTVVPWFRTDLTSAELADELQSRLSGYKGFQAVMGDEAAFGHHKTVNLVAQPTPLIEIEEQVRTALKQHHAWLVDETTKRGREYRPHVTAQKTGRLYRGDCFVVNKLYIIEQKGGLKKIVDLTNLG